MKHDGGHPYVLVLKDVKSITKQIVFVAFDYIL